MIEDRIRQFIVEHLHGPADRLSNDYPLIEHRVVDSLGLMQLVSFLESEYAITIEDEDLVPENFKTIGAIAKLVEARHS
ncbi:MAG TPA: acyl carrier protein [Actinomycetota bacterium]|nr:acyl carrier protein [Actinomycetota bacterium]